MGWFGKLFKGIGKAVKKIKWKKLFKWGKKNVKIGQGSNPIGSTTGWNPNDYRTYKEKEETFYEKYRIPVIMSVLAFFSLGLILILKK